MGQCDGDSRPACYEQDVWVCVEREGGTVGAVDEDACVYCGGRAGVAEA